MLPSIFYEHANTLDKKYLTELTQALHTQRIQELPSWLFSIHLVPSHFARYASFPRPFRSRGTKNQLLLIRVACPTSSVSTLRRHGTTRDSLYPPFLLLMFLHGCEIKTVAGRAGNEVNVASKHVMLNHTIKAYK